MFDIFNTISKYGECFFSFSTQEKSFLFLSKPNIFQQVPLVRIQRPAICLAPRQNQQHMVRLNNFDHNRALFVLQHTHGEPFQNFHVNQSVLLVSVVKVYSCLDITRMIQR